MSSVSPSSQSSSNANGRTRSRWAGTGLGGDVIATEHERNTMTNKQLQEKFGRGTEGYAERAAVRRWMDNLDDDRDLSQVTAEARQNWANSQARPAVEQPRRRGVERSR